jgi:itaconate CoA-transferase
MPDTFGPRMDAVPTLGQHAEPILAELGYSSGEIQELRHDGAI